MSAVKIHAVLGTDHGTESCDFRGDLFIGHDQGDEHRTLAEIDPASDSEIEMALEFGPKANELFGRLAPAKGVGDIFGKDAFLRIGVWDE